MAVRASRTSSNLNGLMIAITIFMGPIPAWARFGRDRALSTELHHAAEAARDDLTQFYFRVTDLFLSWVFLGAPNKGRPLPRGACPYGLPAPRPPHTLVVGRSGECRDNRSEPPDEQICRPHYHDRSQRPRAGIGDANVHSWPVATYCSAARVRSLL